MLTMAAAVPAAAQSTPPPAAEPNPLTHVVQNLGRDIKDFIHLDTVTILGIGGTATIVTSRYDDSAYEWSLDHPAPEWTRLGRISGDGWVQGGLALGTWALGELTDHSATRHVGSDLVRAQLLNFVTTRTLKIAVDRRRPSGGGHSFPSGHSSASFTTAGVLQRHFGWKAGVPAYAAAGFIGLTRVRDRAHWVSDTVFGASLGIAAAFTVTRGHGPQSWTVTPTAVPGGAGLLIRW